VFKLISRAPANDLPINHEIRKVKRAGPAVDTISIESWPDAVLSGRRIRDMVRHIPERVITYWIIEIIKLPIAAGFPILK